MAVPGFESADLGLADSAQFFQGQSAGASVGGEVGRERGDALQESLGAGVEVEFAGSSWLGIAALSVRVALGGSGEFLVVKELAFGVDERGCTDQLRQ